MEINNTHILSNNDLYIGFAGNYYQNYVDAFKDYEKFLDEIKPCINPVNKTISMEDNQKLAELFINKLKNAMAFIIFEALTVESMINLCGINAFGRNNYFQKYDRKELEDKCKIVYEKITGIQLESILVNRIKILRITRNRLVHDKGMKIRLGDYDDVPFTALATIDSEDICIDELVNIICSISCTLRDLIDNNHLVDTEANEFDYQNRVFING